MNKQAITFLSLFSLILVLSVFYILLPPVEDNEVTVIQEQTSEVAAMQEQLNSSREELVTNSNSIIASSSSSSQDIENALEDIANTKTIVAKEAEILELLIAAGYTNAYVEINETNIIIVVEKENASSSDANAIIKLIMNEYGQTYQIEVKFV